MPPVRPEVVRGNLHELEEQQQGDDEPLPLGRRLVKDRPVRFQRGGEVIEKVEGDARDDSEGQHPVLEDPDGLMHAEPA